MNEPRKDSKQKRVRKDVKIGTIRSKEQGVSRKEFHAILDKASQPIKHEAQSDSK
jgi:hypothetical protein